MTVPTSCISQTFHAFARAMVAPIGRVNIGITIAMAGLTIIAYLKWVAVVAVFTSLTMRTSVASWTSVTNIT